MMILPSEIMMLMVMMMMMMMRTNINMTMTITMMIQAARTALLNPAAVLMFYVKWTRNNKKHGFFDVSTDNFNHYTKVNQ